MQQTVRRSMIITFWAFLLFLVAEAALGKITDPRAPFDVVAHIYRELDVTYSLQAYSSEVVMLAILPGGLPVLFVAIRRAFATRPKAVLGLFRLRPKLLLWLLVGSFLLSVVFVSYIIGTEVLFRGSTPVPPVGALLLNALAGIAVLTLLAFVLALIAAALSGAVVRSGFGSQLLTFALLTMLVATLAMGVSAISTSLWVARLWIDVPRLAMSDAGLGASGMAWVVAVIIAMVLATMASTLACWQGLRARRSLVA